MEKASIKHLDFQLQREKARTKDLEIEYKALHAQVAQLEQDKAGLRREKLVLGEEAKKITKLEDRIHSLQKEVESRDAIIASERAAAEQARAETEEIRGNANASITQWIEAEKQWTAEQAALNEAAVQFQKQIGKLESELSLQRSASVETTRLLQLERDRSTKLTSGRETLETEVKTMRSQTEKLQNKICDLEQTIYKLDIAGDKQRETIDLKDTEIKTLEAALENQTRTAEKLEQTIGSLGDRINAAKMLNLEGRGENEKLQCDLNDAKKEIERLNLQIDSLKRDSTFSAQSQSSLQKALDELRERCRQQQEDLKEKNVEVRRHELTISQLNVELKKIENQGGEWSFQYSSLEAELHRTKDALKSCVASVETLSLERADLLSKLRDLQSAVEAKDEEMVLLQSNSDERHETLVKDLQSLEKEVAARQAVINDLSDQLASTSGKNAVYHTKILEETEESEKMKHELSQVLQHIQAKEQELLLARCASEKASLYASCLEEWHIVPQTQVRGWFALWQQSQHQLAIAQQEVDTLTLKSGSQGNDLAGQRRLLSEKEQRIENVQQEVHSKGDEILSLTQDIASQKEKFANAQSMLNSALQQVDFLTREVCGLKEQLSSKDAILSEKDMLHGEAQMRNATCLSFASSLESRCTVLCAEQVELVRDWWNAQLGIVVDMFVQALEHGKSEKAALRFAKEEAEATCRELTIFAKEAKATMSSNDRAVAEKQAALLSRITLLEGQAAFARKEKEQANGQLSTLLRRFEEEQKASETRKKNAQAALEAEQQRAAAAERDARKLRSAVEYEVKRKCEYKAALEGAKRLLAESEEMRHADSARALEAIKKSSKEADYWVLCFDRLKSLIEKSRTSGARLPSIDADTIHRLEEAKNKISPIQSHDVNAVISNVPKLKRARAQASGASE